jgi:chromosomal replication initiation ATPase DnaA
MKQQNRKIIIRKEKEYTIGFLLDFITVGEQVKVVAEIQGGKMIVSNIENVRFQRGINNQTKTVRKATEEENTISHNQIMDIVSTVTGLKSEDIKGKGKTDPYVHARFAFAALCVKYRFNECISEVGRFINRDHSTIIAGQKKHDIYMNYDDYSEMFNKCEAEIKAII